LAGGGSLQSKEECCAQGCSEDEYLSLVADATVSSEERSLISVAEERRHGSAVRRSGFTFSQPDGTPIHVRGWGDQYYAVFETLDGYTVAKNPATGYWEVARRDYPDVYDYGYESSGVGPY
jgi:hypothetical protein